MSGYTLNELQRELCAAVVERVLEEPKDDPEHCVADRRLAEGSAVGGELRQVLAGRVVAVDEHGHRPGRDVLDEARQQAAENRRPRQGRLEPRVRGAQDRAVLHVEREADGSPRVTSLPRISTSSYLESKRRLSSGCSSVITTVATAPATPPRKLVCCIGQACQGVCTARTGADQRLDRRSATR